jgi:hypothetical protein
MGKTGAANEEAGSANLNPAVIKNRRVSTARTTFAILTRRYRETKEMLIYSVLSFPRRREPS